MQKMSRTRAVFDRKVVSCVNNGPRDNEAIPFNQQGAPLTPHSFSKGNTYEKAITCALARDFSP